MGLYGGVVGMFVIGRHTFFFSCKFTFFLASLSCQYPPKIPKELNQTNHQ